MNTNLITIMDNEFVYYQLSHEYLNYTHGESLEQNKSFDVIKKAFDDCVNETIQERLDGYSNTDALMIEEILVTLDEDGEVDEVLDFLEVIEEHTFNEEQ